MSVRDPLIAFDEGVPTSLASRSFVNNVRLAIQAQQRTRIRPEQRTGKLYKRALIRPVLPPVDGGAWNSKIFYKRDDHKKINTACTVLVDCSGSMSGTKLEHASQAACLLTNTLAKALHVPTEVLCFAFSSVVTMGIVKAFDTPLMTDAQIAGGIYTSYRSGGGGNDDANALLFAYERLLKRKEAKRMLIVLSDGSPADSPNRGSDPDDGLKYVTDAIRKRNLVSLYGIGICDSNVKRYYGSNARVIHRSSDLESVLVETLSQSVFVD